jgi:hypothetical protein
MRAILPLLAILAAPLAGAAEKPILAILDFESPDDPKLGARVAERLDKRALEANTHVLIDRDDIQQALEESGLKVRLEGHEKDLQAFARDKLGAHLVMWGRIKRLDGSKLLLHVRCMDTHGDPKPYLDVSKECANFAAIANFYTEFEDVFLKKRAALRVLTPVDDAAKARNLVHNPSFEEGTWTPTRWTSKVDGLTTFWLDREDGKGKCLLCDTDVDENQALEWGAKVQAGQATAKDAPKPIRSEGKNIYGTIGAWEGIQFYSDLLPVKPKMRYRITVDIKARWGGIFFPKAFVKGYADMKDGFTNQKREVYNCYLALRTETQGKEWETFTRTFNPTLRTPQVKWMGVMLYSYWPLGKYYWDNIRITEEAIED